MPLIPDPPPQALHRLRDMMDDDALRWNRSGREQWMGQALELAASAVETADVPVGALVVDDQGQVIGRGVNRREADGDPTAHAEILALRAAAQAIGGWQLSGCSLVVTLEPCTMCAGAIVSARIARLVFGAWDEKAGACGSVHDLVRDSRLNHRVEVFGGVREAESSRLLREFFDQRR